MSTSLPQGRKPVFILSHPRTASNLFMKIFKSHPEIVQIEYPFLDSFYFGSESQCDRKGAQIEKKRAELQEQNRKPKTYRGCFEKLEENICEALEQVSFPVSQNMRRIGKQTRLILVKREK
jgi:hypothetical protein